MDYNIALTDQMDAQLQTSMLTDKFDENACLSLWLPSIGRSRLTGIINTVLVPRSGEVKRHGNVTVDASYMDRGIETARQAKSGLAIIHTHPAGNGWQMPSSIDIKNELGLLGRSVYGVTGYPLIGMILSGDGCWSGRLYPLDDGGNVEHQECSAVRVVGRRLRMHYNPFLRPPLKMVRSQYRTRTVWGKENQSMIMRLHVGVIGAGSVGGQVAETLARMGVGRITLMDYDVIEELNLDRLTYASKLDARRKVKKVHVLKKNILRSATTPGFTTRSTTASIVERSGYRQALDCDVLFSCVDRNWPRQVLNHISYSCLIPVVDGGVSIRLAENGELIHAVYRAQTIGPSRPCLSCLGMYDAGKIQLERDGVLDNPKYIEQLGKNERLQLEQERQNIMPFSMGLASLETLQFSELLTYVARWGDLGVQQFDFLNADMQSDHGRICHSECEYVRMIGKGSTLSPYLSEDKAKTAVNLSNC
ncbi:MAG: ThiF family adenylyltransferase [Nitrososphaerota archaeon]|nr:ThiF family adenylyltransferase [Nitrososphaerota archaeon]